MPVPLPVQHVLAACLIVVYPVWDYYDTRELRKGTDPRAKLKYYKKTILLECIAAIVAFWAVGPQILTLHVVPPQIAQRHPTIASIVAACAALFVMFVVLAPHFQALSNVKVRRSLMRQTAHLAFFFPKTSVEFRWFAILSVTAGICEELLFRGFLIRYLGVAPWHLGLIAAVLLAAPIFGAAHLYQGIQGLISTTIGAFIFAGLFLWTGNLLLPMIFHAVADLVFIPTLQRSDADQAAA